MYDAGADQIRMGRQGKKRMKLVTKKKKYALGLCSQSPYVCTGIPDSSNFLCEWPCVDHTVL